MKNLNTIIAESVSAPRKNYVQEAVNQILGEDINVGQSVAIIDDVMTGMTGARGKVKKISDSNPGFAEVELESGASMPMQTSLLIPV